MTMDAISEAMASIMTLATSSEHCDIINSFIKETLYIMRSAKMGLEEKPVSIPVESLNNTDTGLVLSEPRLAQAGSGLGASPELFQSAPLGSLGGDLPKVNSLRSLLSMIPWRKK